ncbi:F-box only 43 [Pelobates cultripes]|uniref:F-box only 43 n=1 Tax=Pelobates cultripes TaxID=61616 RepID=A0AAD1W3T3_PELCU|nr:F-box only 43 [Pelobates cultripes]
MDSSTYVSQDSGFNETLKAFSPDSNEHHSGSLVKITPTQRNENSENIDPTLVLSPIKSERIWDPLTDTKQSSVIYETPRVTKKDFSLRRRLLVSKATSGGKSEFYASEYPADIFESKKSIQMCPNFEANLSNDVCVSPRDAAYTPIATSTLKAEAESGTSCKKWRLAFAQHRTSTLDDSKFDDAPFPEVENLSPVQCLTDSVTDDRNMSINEENLSESPGTPTSNLISCTKEEFQTPVTNLAAKFNFDLCTPIGTPEYDLESSLTGDSAFHSLSFDKSQDSLNDHEGSFQELIQKQRETPKGVQSKSRPRKLERCKRLSTLRERGSQSEVEEECVEAPLLSLEYKSKVARDSVDEEIDTCSESYLLKVEDLTGTPALRVVRDMITRSSRKRSQQTTVQDILENDNSSELSESVLTRLIGRKMGLENIDILAELKYRNLNHVLSCILQALPVESICSIWKVSCEWREIVHQDRSSYQRRKGFLKKLKAEAEEGRLVSSEDSVTRLNLLTRSALKSVQTQARSAFQTPNNSLSPKDTSFTPQSSRKHQEYIKIAKTLFTDEALKPCPRCQFPAKYQPLKKQGRCSRKDCGFNFCILCLCAFHGSKECASGSAKRTHKKEPPPGSAQSKRNLRRL